MKSKANILYTKMQVLYPDVFGKLTGFEISFRI